MVALVLLAGAVVVFGVTQANGQGGAALADGIRAVAGPVAAAQVEAGYLAVGDNAHRLLYHLGIGKAQAPWAAPTATTAGGTTAAARPAAAAPPLPVAAASGSAQAPATTPLGAGSAAPPDATVTHAAAPAPTAVASNQPPPAQALAPLVPKLSPALPGEGQWETVVAGASPGQPLVSNVFWRPDPVRPYAIVTLLAFDLSGVRLGMVAGTTEPGGPLGHAGPGTIPTADQQPGTLLAVFNGGFKEANGAFGMMVNGRVYVPPVASSGTIAITRSGQVLMGVWGSDPALAASNPNLVAWRQNGPLLINHGAITSLTDNIAAWGQTVGGSYTWRSGIGLTGNGRLVYAAGNAVSARTLAEALQAAGAVTAMQLDINPYWVRAFTYAPAPGGGLAVTKLQSTMYGTGREYLQGEARDFFYVARRQP